LVLPGECHELPDNFAPVKKLLQGHPCPERPVPEHEQEKEGAGLDCEPGPGKSMHEPDG